MKRLNNIDAYEITSASGRDYVVTVERIQNDRNGNGRAQYVIIPRGEFYAGAGVGKVFRSYVYRGGKYDAADVVENYEKQYIND